jgi:Flp pilus assembly protein TadG
MIKHQLRDGEDGNMAVSMAIIIPVVMLIAGLMLVGGYLATSSGAVQTAANEAARAASIARTSGTANSSATSTATSTLANSGTPCSSTQVSANTAGFNTPIGQPGEVSVTVTCVVPLIDLPGIPASRSITATGTSVVDAYRGRS